MPAKKDDDKKAIRVLISMQQKFLDAIDKLAEHEQRTRSELIREALRQYLSRNSTQEKKEDQPSG